MFWNRKKSDELLLKPERFIIQADSCAGKRQGMSYDTLPVTDQLIVKIIMPDKKKCFS